MERDLYVIRELAGQPFYWIKFGSVQQALNCINASSFCRIDEKGYPKAPDGVLFHISHHPESDKATLMIGGKQITSFQMQEIAGLAVEKGGRFEKAHLRGDPGWAGVKDYIMAWFEEQPKGTPLEFGVI